MSSTSVKQFYVAHKAMISICVASLLNASTYVYAEGPKYIYPTDIIKETRSNKDQRKNWRYRQPPPSKTQRNPITPINQPTYLQPIQEPGSNPFTSPGQRYRFVDKNDTDRSTDVMEENYNYPPPTQKPGSNPFFR